MTSREENAEALLKTLKNLCDINYKILVLMNQRLTDLEDQKEKKE